MEHSQGSSLLTNAKAGGLTKVDFRNGFHCCRIDELASRINKQNGSKTFRRLHGPIGGLTPLEALQFIKARNLNTMNRLPACKFEPPSTKAKQNVSQTPSMWFAVKRRKPVSRLPRYVVRSRGDPLIKVASGQWDAAYKDGREAEPTGFNPCKPTYRLIRRGKCIHGITVYPSLAMVIHPPQSIAPFESGDERCDLCGTVSKLAEMTQARGPDLTSSPLMRSAAHLTPILETYKTQVQAVNKDPVPVCPQHHQRQKKQKLQQECLNFVKKKDAANGATSSPLVDISNSTCDRGSVDAIQPRIGSSEAIPLSLVDGPGATETLQVTIPSCKITSDVTPRQSAYKEPSDRRVQKKVRLAILVHPTATPTTCFGSKRDIATPYHSSTTNSFSDSLTDCSQSVTTFSSGSDNLMPDLDSCILDNHSTDSSKAYDFNENGESAFEKSFNSYQEKEVKEKRMHNLGKNNVQNTLTYVASPPCPSPVSECSSSTIPTNFSGHKKGHKGEDLVFNVNEPLEMPVSVTSTFQMSVAAVERSLGDEGVPHWAPKRVSMSKLSNISPARWSLEPPKPEVQVTSPYTCTSRMEQIDSISEGVGNEKSCERTSFSLNATIEPVQTNFSIGMEGSGSLLASLEPTIRTHQDYAEAVVEVSNLPPLLHRIPLPLSPYDLFRIRCKRAAMEEAKFLNWVLKCANVPTMEMNTVIMRGAPNVLKCTKHRFPQMKEVEDSLGHCTDEIHMKVETFTP